MYSAEYVYAIRCVSACNRKVLQPLSVDCRLLCVLAVVCGLIFLTGLLQGILSEDRCKLFVSPKYHLNLRSLCRKCTQVEHGGERGRMRMRFCRMNYAHETIVEILTGCTVEL